MTATFDEDGFVKTIMVDAKKLSEMATELKKLRDMNGQFELSPLWNEMLRELEKAYNAWAAGQPVEIDSLMQAYDRWLD